VTLVGLLCTPALIAIAAGVFGREDSASSVAADLHTEEVTQGRFIRTIPAQGDVRNYRPAMVFNDCRNHQREILELVPEGTWVEEGDVVCVLDCAELTEKLKVQEIELIKARGALAAAETREVLQEHENDRLLSAADLQARVAQDKLLAYEKAESLNEIERLKGALEIARENLAPARDSLDHTRRMTASGFRTLTQLAQADTRLQSLQRSTDQARGQLELMQRYQKPRSLLELRGDASDAQREVVRTQLVNDLLQSDARLTVLAREKWVAGVEWYVDYLTRSIAACTMRSPRSGQVVYADRGSGRRWIEVGSYVHYTQDILYIADMERLTVNGRISDRHIYAAGEGQQVQIRSAKYPDRSFGGTLEWIAPIPTPSEWFRPQELYHKMQVLPDDVEDWHSRLTPGTNVEMTITVDDRPDVIQVPLQAVFNHNDDYAVIVLSSKGLARRVIEAGESSSDAVEVISGLIPGERVVIDEATALRQLADSLL
jgi:HlyD family secretion protein